MWPAGCNLPPIIERCAATGRSKEREGEREGKDRIKGRKTKIDKGEGRRLKVYVNRV